MKLQDVGFLFVFVLLVFFKKPNYFLIAGLLCLIFAIPLFATWTFYTAERLTWYAAGFIFVSLLLQYIA